MRSLRNRKSGFLISITRMSALFFFLALSCRTTGPQKPNPSLEDQPEAAGSGGIPSEPDDPVLRFEWQNMHLYLRKAAYAQRVYGPTNAATVIAREKRKAEASARAVRQGEAPPLVAGLREEGYLAENDGSFQPFVRFLPSRGAPADGYPMVVYLHGYSPDLNIINWEYIPSSLIEFAETEGFCVAVPYGRGNTDFQGIGEQDVLNVMAEMTRRYNIDEDRIVLAGISMGGMGVWTVGAHYPDMFAGLAVVAGRGDYYFWHGVERDEVPFYKRMFVDTHFGYSLLPNLSNLPAFCVHGTADSLIPVEEARHFIKALEQINSSVEYVEIEEGDHWIYEKAFAMRGLRDWMKKRRRPDPARFRYISYHPRYRGYRWARMSDFRRRRKAAVLTLEAGGNAIAASVEGADTLAIYPDLMPERLRNVPVNAAGRFNIRYRLGESGRYGPRKARGPVNEAFLSPFVFVRASADSPDSRRRFIGSVADWYWYADALPRVASEGSITKKELVDYNVFVFGEPEDSVLMQKALEGSPVRITQDNYVVGKRRFARRGNGLWLTRPSPWNRSMLVVVQSGLQWGAGLSNNHKYDFLPDYMVYSDERDEDGSNTALCAGFFDANWELSPELMYVGE
ncbi:MAG: prolyl oligopeptidase family serine peptidase [Kiritimatiellia bacterium]